MIEIVPAPGRVEMQRGRCRLVAPAVEATGVAPEVVERLLGVLGESGQTAAGARGEPTGRAVVALTQTKDHGEGYVLRIDHRRVELLGGHRGLHNAVSALHQLLLLHGRELPCGLVESAPRFRWRGLHLDTCRHMFSVSFLCKVLDMMALYHLNPFHWHLTEDQGWRVQIERHPELTEIGAWRVEESGRRYGGYYTKADVRRVVEHARRLGIEVVPEIEMPGHSQAVLAAYPNLGCMGREMPVRSEWGISKEVLCAGNEEVFRMLEDVLDEMLEMFPSQYVHVGGDECPKDRWRECPKCQERIRLEGLEDEEGLQSYFIRRIGEYLAMRDRVLVGWDEILEGGLPPNAVVMSWRGMGGGLEAARLGHQVIMAPSNPCYLNMRQAPGEGQPGVRRRGTPVVDLASVYSWDPVPADLDVEAARNILGGQACMWSEHVSEEPVAEYLLQPRLAALSEVLWNPPEQRNWRDFVRKMSAHQPVLEAMNWAYRRSPELGWSGSTSA